MRVAFDSFQSTQRQLTRRDLFPPLCVLFFAAGIGSDMPGAPTSSLVAAIMSNTAAPPTLQQQHHQHQLQQQLQQQSRLAESTSVYVSGLPRDIDEKDLGTSRPCVFVFPTVLASHRFVSLPASQRPCFRRKGR